MINEHQLAPYPKRSSRLQGTGKTPCITSYPVASHLQRRLQASDRKPFVGLARCAVCHRSLCRLASHRRYQADVAVWSRKLYALNLPERVN